ncbi:hypothetical protein ACFXTO_032744 [Malus domestica]
MTRSSHPVREHILDFDDDFERELRRKRKNPEPSESSSNSEAEVEIEEEEPTAQVGEVETVMVQDNRTIKELSAWDWTMPHLYVFNIRRLPKERLRNSS